MTIRASWRLVFATGCMLTKPFVVTVSALALLDRVLKPVDFHGAAPAELGPMSRGALLLVGLVAMLQAPLLVAFHRRVCSPIRGMWRMPACAG